MSDTIAINSLKPGDILLYQGTSFLSRMIRGFDGTDYSHASLYDGERVVEALAAGITVNTVNESVGTTTVDVFRFRSENGGHLGDTEFPVKPIMSRVEFYETNHQRYAYEQIVFLALLTTTRKLPVSQWVPGLGIILRTILDSASDSLTQMIAKGKEPVICSELAFRCFEEAEPAGKYHLKIVGAQSFMKESLYEAQVRGVEPLSAPQGTTEARELAAASKAFLARYAEAKKGMPGLPQTEALDSRPVVANFVTPGDLSKSPNLTFEGRLVL